MHLPSFTANPSVLTIAGSDPSGGAGIQADLRVFSVLGVAGLSAVAALTVQESCGVRAVYPVKPEVLVEQIEAVFYDCDISAVKIGMLGGLEQVRAVAHVLKERRPPNVVLDPVLASTAGFPLLDGDAQSALMELLLPVCHLVTPNLQEAAALTGIDAQGADGMREAGMALIARGAGAALVKGGHLEGAPIDLLVTPDGHGRPFSGRRIDTPHTHGTGCFLSAAIAAYLARGHRLEHAIRCAKDLLTEALEHPAKTGKGRGYPDVAAAAGLRPLASPLNAHRPEDAAHLLPPTPYTLHPTPSPRSPDTSIRGLYVVTDSDLRPDRSAEEIVAAALEAGAQIVQLREKRLPTPGLVELAREFAHRCRMQDALFIVNDRVEVAMAAGADGVHLGPKDMHPADARRVMGPNAIIGVSVSTVEEAMPIAEYASYLGVGAIYGSATKGDAGPAVGVERIREIKRAFPQLPIVAIGGIHAGNIAQVAAAGADSAAVVSAVVNAPDMAGAARELIHRFEEGVRARLIPQSHVLE